MRRVAEWVYFHAKRGDPAPQPVRTDA
jgi:hypothetical protein